MIISLIRPCPAILFRLFLQWAKTVTHSRCTRRCQLLVIQTVILDMKNKFIFMGMFLPSSNIYLLYIHL
ncbi:MAG: hypothetical protein HJJLKODD_02772 [Phycisphaerae bacterium]|nr:hypothetical protein [Phycisphaerae bacterium]